MSYGSEKAIKFGSGGSLVGIVTDPAAGSTADGNPGFVMLNSGILHRVGSCRLHVRLARALSAAGFTSLRFDYSGVGDSDPRRDALSFEEGAVIETRDAMDYLAKTRGTQRFVLMGLCSGADMAHQTAVVDNRVAGLVQLDAWAYRNVAHYVHHFASRLLKWRAWQNAIKIRYQMVWGTYRDRSAPPAVADGVELDAPAYVRVFPPREQVGRDLKEFVNRGIALYCIWSGGLPEYNHHGQFASVFRDVPFGGLLREEYRPESDHIVSGLHHQDYVVRNVVGWANGLRHAGGAPSMAAAHR